MKVEEESSVLFSKNRTSMLLTKAKQSLEDALSICLHEKANSEFASSIAPLYYLIINLNSLRLNLPWCYKDTSNRIKNELEIAIKALNNFNNEC